MQMSVTLITATEIFIMSDSGVSKEWNIVNG
jgi:hypothetical protein